MQAIAFAWQAFYGQFAPYVFSDGDLIEDPQNTKYPRITYSYQVSDFFNNSLSTFQVWDYGFNNARLFEVCDKISLAVPVQSGTEIIIPGETYFEYLNPISGFWVRFEIADFQEIAEEFAPKVIEWRRVETDTSGAIEIHRGSPFLTPSPKDEQLSRAMYGTLISRYLTTI